MSLNERQNSRTSMFAAMEVTGYPRLWAVGLLINLSRWITLFLASYLANELTHSVFLVQLVGACVFAPLFAGGLVAGVVTDRLDRQRVILAIHCLLLPTSLVMAWLNLTGRIEVWMVYPFVVLVGTSHLIDMTTRRALVYDCVGSDLVTNAMALESIARTAGAVVGGLVAGAVISALGIGEVFLVITFLYCLSTAMVLGLSSAPSAPQAAESPSFVRELTSGLRYVRSQRPLLSILGVTILINVFYFPFQPMLPIFGDRLGVSAFWAGLLLSAHGLGSAAGASVIANGPNLRKGAIYTGGSAVALAFLFLFAAVRWYPIAVLSLLAAGFAIAGFGTMQSVLVMVTSDDAMRGRAMGILSMSIGVLPFSTLLLGALASVVGPAAGVMINASIGLLALMAFSLRRPEAHRLP